MKISSEKLAAEAEVTGFRECRDYLLSMVLPFADNERYFLDLLLDRGVIDPTVLTDDISLQQRIQRQPLLHWKSINVKNYMELT